MLTYEDILREVEDDVAENPDDVECDTSVPRCARQAVYRFVYELTCACSGRDHLLLCIPHEEAARGVDLECATCRAPVVYVRTEKL